MILTAEWILCCFSCGRRAQATWKTTNSNHATLGDGKFELLAAVEIIVLIWVKLIYSFPYFYHCSSLFSANVITVHMICFHFLLLSFVLVFSLSSRHKLEFNWKFVIVVDTTSRWPSLSFWNQNTTLWLMNVINRHQEGFLTCLRVRFNSHSGSPCVRCYLIVEAKTSLQIRKYINLINLMVASPTVRFFVELYGSGTVWA